MSPRSSRGGGWLRLWFGLRTLALRVRFLTGKASFVEADIQMTTNSVAELPQAPGSPPRRRLLSHYQLRTRAPRTGRQGWDLFEERTAPASPHQTLRLICAYCGHHFIVQILAAIDPLASDVTGGKSPGEPASYSSDWFKFQHPRYHGEPSLYCPRCEQNSAPRVEFFDPSGPSFTRRPQ